MVHLQKLNIPPSGGMSHVVAKRVFDLVISTCNSHVDVLFDMYHENQESRMSKDFKCPPLTLNSARTYFLPAIVPYERGRSL